MTSRFHFSLHLNSCSPLLGSLLPNGPNSHPRFFRICCASDAKPSCPYRNPCARSPHHHPKQQSTEFESITDCAYENVLGKFILIYFDNLLIVIIYMIARFHFFSSCPARAAADLQDCPETSSSSHRACLGMMKTQPSVNHHHKRTRGSFVHCRWLQGEQSTSIY
jgi:hypothetical protein